MKVGTRNLLLITNSMLFCIRYRTDSISIFVCGRLLEAKFWGNLHEKLTFLASKLGYGPLLEHGPLIEFFTVI